jgi:hypothetical protein
MWPKLQQASLVIGPGEDVKRLSEQQDAPFRRLRLTPKISGHFYAKERETELRAHLTDLYGSSCTPIYCSYSIIIYIFLH